MGGVELGDLDLEKLAGTRKVLIVLSEDEYNKQKENVAKIDEINLLKQ